MTAGMSLLFSACAGVIGFLLGMYLNQPLEGAILFALLAGIYCVVAAVNGKREPEENKDDEK